MMSNKWVLAMIFVCGVPTAAVAQNLMVPDTTSDQVFLISGFDGSLIDDSFLDVATQASNAGVSTLAIEALEVGEEIWVSDQNADRIWRFARNGSFLGDVGAGQVDNIRGMEVVGDTVFLAHSGGTKAFAEGIVTIDVPSLTLTGSFSGRDPGDTSYWDVKFYNGELLVTNSDSDNDGIERYSLDGDFLGFFAQSDGETSFDFLQQLNIRSTNTNLLGGGFGLPSGVYEFESDGTDLGIVAAEGFGPRAAFELGNGQIAWTNGAGIGTGNEVGSLIDGGNFRFINVTSVPEPGGLFLMGTLALGVLGRRWRNT